MPLLNRLADPDRVKNHQANQEREKREMEERKKKEAEEKKWTVKKPEEKPVDDPVPVQPSEADSQPGCLAKDDSSETGLSPENDPKAACKASLTGTYYRVTPSASVQDEHATPSAPLAGFKSGVKVYHYVGRIEKELACIRTRTPLGTRFLPNPVEDCSIEQTSDSGRQEAGGPYNRVFKNEFFRVGKSPTAGYGAFAAKDILYGDVILVEKPLLVSDHMTLYDQYDALSPAGREAFNSLVAYSSGGVSDRTKAIASANSFHIKGASSAVFGIASNFNHACQTVRKVRYVFDGERNVIVMTAIDNIAAGEELLICYGGTPVDLYDRYGFVCQCGGCCARDTKRKIQAKRDRIFA